MRAKRGDAAGLSAGDPRFQGAPEGGPESPAVSVRNLYKEYGRRESKVVALNNVSQDFMSATFTAVMGPSGSGKSTLLMCTACLDRPTSGTVFLGTTELTRIREPQLTEIRRERIGFVFQSFNLVPYLSAWENILLPLKLAGRRPDTGWASEIIERVGLAERVRHRPSELSNGQQQRVALARAIVTRPLVIFADEPTGALDLTAGRQVMDLLRDAVDTLGQTVVMVTHDPRAAAYADRVLFFADGAAVAELPDPTTELVAEHMTRISG
jgi:putative ABC transport system ATP-binding protein